MRAAPACLRSREDLVDVADRDVARVGAVRVSAAAKIHRELEHGHIEGRCRACSDRVRLWSTRQGGGCPACSDTSASRARAKTARQHNPPSPAAAARIAKIQCGRRSACFRPLEVDSRVVGQRVVRRKCPPWKCLPGAPQDAKRPRGSDGAQARAPNPKHDVDMGDRRYH